MNFERLPVNAPKATRVVNTYQRDGLMRFDDNSGSAPNYEPNSFGGPTENPVFAEPPLKISGDADRYEQKRGVDDDYVQPGNLYRLMPPDEQARLIKNIVGSLGKTPREIQEKMNAAEQMAYSLLGGSMLGLALTSALKSGILLISSDEVGILARA